MLDFEYLHRVIPLREKAYELLLWLSDAIARGFISHDSAEKYVSQRQFFENWLLKHRHNIPKHLIPEDKDLSEFCNLFISFSQIFEFVENPGYRRVSDCGCNCSLCTTCVEKPHLQTKKIPRSVNSKMTKLMESEALSLAEELNLPTKDVDLMSKYVDEQFVQALAIVSYANQLLLRAQGRNCGPEVLALWRKFAWSPKGSPIKGFKYTLELVKDAKTYLKRRMTA